jgi:hypothetical protein
MANRSATHGCVASFALTLAVVAGLIWTTHAAAATQSQVFDPHCVSRVDITAPQASLDALAIDPKGEYQPGTMIVNICGTEELPTKNITFRLKGSGSFRPLTGKASFKIKMSSPNRIDGLKSLTLNNMVQDDSMIHEALAYKAFRSVGVLAPRAGYAIVSITNSDTGTKVDYGLHSNIESLDDRFLNANLGSGTWGHLYEGPDWLQHGANRDILPDSVANFEVEETAAGASATDLADLANISEIANDDDWWTAFQSKSDMPTVMRFFAAELYTGHWDGYVRNINNYYLRSTLAGVFNFIPWGTDGTFEQGFTLAPTSSYGQLFNRCLQVTACNAEYAVAREFVAETILGLDLVEEAHHLAFTIAAAVTADTRKDQSIEEQCAAANRTVRFLVSREEYWRENFDEDVASTQSSDPIECDESGPIDPWPLPSEPTGPTGPIDPTGPTGSTDTTGTAGPVDPVSVDPVPTTSFSRKVTLKKPTRCLKVTAKLSLSPTYATRSAVATAKLTVRGRSATSNTSPFSPKLKLSNLGKSKSYRYRLVVTFKPQLGLPVKSVIKTGGFRTCA